MTTLLAYVVTFGILVTFHELGHYTVARLCGVKILRFSIGIGKVIFSRRFGRDQTEWVISMLPLGGYVQMLDGRDQDLSTVTEDDLKREFTRKSVWRRFAIVAAGPGANFLLAILLICGLYMYGVPDYVARMNVVPQQTEAYNAGLRGGELITAANGNQIRSWSDLQWNIVQSALEKKSLTLEFDKPATDGHGAMLHDSATVNLTGVSSKDMEGDFMHQLGLELARPKAIIQKVVAASPAMRAGLMEGDFIVSVDDKPVPDQLEIRKLILAAPEKNLRLTVLRSGGEVKLVVIPDAVKSGEKAYGQIGVQFLSPERTTVSYGPFDALRKGVTWTVDRAILQVKLIGKMIIGQLSWKNISGPWTIADIAEQTASMGLVPYLTFIAGISISLGIMNLLPIPVLDGGLLLYYSLEVLTGRPVSARIGEIAQRAGIGILMMLMLVAVFNDVARHLT